MKRYTTQDILLSTKDKLKELDLKLKMLKELTQKSDKIKDINYGLNCFFRYYGPVIYCIVDKDESKLKQLIKRIMNKTSINIGKIEISDDGTYYIKTDKSIIAIPYCNQEAFIKIVNELKQDEFAKEFATTYLQTKDSYKYMQLFPGGVNICNSFVENDKLINTKLSFNLSDETAVFQASDNIILREDMIRDSLNISYPKDLFTDYQKQLIDTSESRTKEIHIPNSLYNNYGTVEFKVNDDSDRVYLVKKYNR